MQLDNVGARRHSDANDVIHRLVPNNHDASRGAGALKNGARRGRREQPWPARQNCTNVPRAGCCRRRGIVGAHKAADLGGG